MSLLKNNIIVALADLVFSYFHTHACIHTEHIS